MKLVTSCYLANVEIHMLKPNPWYGGIRRQSFGEVIRSWGRSLHEWVYDFLKETGGLGVEFSDRAHALHEFDPRFDTQHWREKATTKKRNSKKLKVHPTSHLVRIQWEESHLRGSPHQTLKSASPLILDFSVSILWEMCLSFICYWVITL